MTHATLPGAPAAASPLGEALAGKYLTFCLGQEQYGIAVLKIREIIRMLDVTPVPQMPEYIRGVVNLRGRIIPVVDLRRRFQLAGEAAGDRVCIVVVQVVLADARATLMGMVVDAVEEVVNIQEGDLEATPRFGSSVEPGYILGIAKLKGKVKVLLDIDRVISAPELEEMAASAPLEPAA